MNGRVILSLCDFTGIWSRPYENSGYNVIRIDLNHGQDVRLLRHIAEPIHGILAAPPCTHFSKAGAWKWKEKGEPALLEGLAVVDACLRAVAIYCPVWWVLENPVGRLKDYLGAPKFRFDPCDFGDPWTKKTLLWGCFTPPVSSCPVNPIMIGKIGSRDHTSRLSGGDPRRSATPLGFAQAFFEANP